MSRTGRSPLESGMTGRRRRIVRRAVMALAVGVLLLAFYVATDLTVQWMDGRGSIPKPLRAPAKAFCVPLDWYCETALPGAEWLKWKRIHSQHYGFRARPPSSGFGGK